MWNCDSIGWSRSWAISASDSLILILVDTKSGGVPSLMYPLRDSIGGSVRIPSTGMMAALGVRKLALTCSSELIRAGEVCSIVTSSEDLLREAVRTTSLTDIRSSKVGDATTALVCCWFQGLISQPTK